MYHYHHFHEALEAAQHQLLLFSDARHNQEKWSVLQSCHYCENSVQLNPFAYQIPYTHDAPDLASGEMLD
jgi:hypothetical protein